MTQTSESRQAPFGTWTSELTAATVAAASVRFAEPRRGTDRTWWLEGRPAEAGRTVLVGKLDGQPARDMTPAPYSVRSHAHEYGGGAWTAEGDRAWFVNNADQGIYVIEDESIRRVYQSDQVSFADLQRDPRRERLIAVREDSSGPGEPVASLVAIGDDGTCRELVSGSDFYASPAISPDGERLVWLEWDHPCMPWDGTRMWTAEFHSSGELLPGRYLAGSRDEAIFQPSWAPDGTLYFVSDANEWWNLYRMTGHGIEAVTSLDAEMGLPQWVFGQRTYGFPAANRISAAASAHGQWQLYGLELPDGVPQPLATDLSSIEHVSAGGGATAVLGGCPVRPSRIILFDAGGARELARTGSDLMTPADVSRPRPLTFPVGEGEAAHALFYPPCSTSHQPRAGERPPLLVKCHGGPTGAASAALDLKIQFWTSRGFAVLDVNYRGSTGYGRRYRRALYGRWGQADVEDCAAGARYVCEQGLADPDRLLISGGSAGGYTVLCSLAFNDVFVAGASYYGIGDLDALFATTHKFESRYDHLLIGPDRSAARDRSPLHHAESIRCPVIFFQGGMDKVVPPDQSRAMHEALVRQGIATAYVEFPDEAHGFRQAATIQRALESELAFYARVLGLEMPAGAGELEIRNASALRGRPPGA